MKNVLRRIVKNMGSDLVRLADNLGETFSSAQAAKSFFKGGIVLLSGVLLALAGTGQFLYQQDIEANKVRFEVEAALGAPLDSETKCAVLQPALVAQCRLAQYQDKSLKSSLKLFLTIYQWLFYGGLFLIALSAMAYFGHAVRPREKV